MFATVLRIRGRQIVGHFIHKKGLQQNAKSRRNNEFTEISIDVPWGKIAGKLWGSSNKQPILAIHGWMDNAGSFDPLIPHLKDCSVLAVDLPGHGLSSWIPPGFFYSEMLYLQTIQRLKNHFKWKKVKFLAHSAGGIWCFTYATHFPKDVEFVISLDSVANIPVRVSDICKGRAETISKFLEYEKVTSPVPSYSEEEVIQRWMKGTAFQSLNESITKILMIRGSTRKEDGTVFLNRDIRLKLDETNKSYTVEHLEKMAELVTCPYLAVKTTGTSLLDKRSYWSRVPDVLRKHCKEFLMVTVEGKHHAHMVTPDPVAEAINSFLEKYNK